jgi:hypothetical protein
VCSACTSCGPSEFQAAACTLNGDAVCEALTQCEPNEEYETVAATVVSDRTCAALTVCRVDLEFASQLPTETSDRICTLATVCNALQYETTPLTPTSNRACADVTLCSGGQYEALAPTTTSDRICRPRTVCEPGDEFQAAPPSATTDRICLPLTECSEGISFEAQRPTATSDRVCELVTPCRDRVPREVQNICAACQNDLEGSGGTPSAVCREAYQAASVCLERSLDEFLSAGPHCAVCDNQGSTSEGCSTAGIQWVATLCGLSYVQFELSPPTLQRDRICEPITLCDRSNAYISVPATPTSDRFCQSYTECNPQTEYQSVSPTTTSDRSCAEISTCELNEYEVKAPGSASDRECAALTQCLEGPPTVVQQLCLDCEAAIRGMRPVPVMCTGKLLQPAVCNPSGADAIDFSEVATEQHCALCQSGGTGPQNPACLSTALAWASAVCADPWQEFEARPPTATSDR